uniref:TniQ family protein n=1 Tax=Enterocloster aldenensis TaxID=358742 RepID=UPI00140E4E31
MLNYFPTPYPDELWYSVLCRYHIRTGNHTHLTTIKELFSGKSYAAMGSFFPNNILYEVIQQLPEGTFDIEDVALNHTLFKYSFRFQPREKKMEMLKLIKEGRSAFPMKLSEVEQKFPKIKICPICMKEDKEKYGESYWHLSHQIPLVNICHKHKCSLWVHECPTKNELNRNFILPDICKVFSKDYEVKPYDEFLTETLTQYQYMPLEVGPTDGYNNIYEALINEGYGTVRKNMDFIMNLKKISDDLCQLFGEDLIRRNFLRKNINRLISNDMRMWRIKSPERYALIATLIGQPPEITFSMTKIENHLYKKFTEFSKEPVPHSKEYIAKQLGIKPDYVNIIASNLGITPFWNENPNEKINKKERIIISLTLEQKQQIKKYVKSQGFTNGSTFILYCIDYTMKAFNID